MRQTNTKEKKSTKPKKKHINTHGYNVSNFFVLDIPVRRDRETGRLMSTTPQSSKKSN